MLAKRAGSVLVLLALALPALAQEVPQLGSVSPLWVGFERPEGLELQRPGGPGWRFAFAAAYGNTAHFSPEVIRHHEGVSGIGAPLEASTVDEARELWPTADIFAVDTEVIRLDFETVYAWKSRWEIGARLPMWRLAGTALDAWPSRLHDVLGVSNNGRDSFPEGQTFVALRPLRGGEWNLIGTTGSEVVNASLWTGRSFAIGDRGWHRAWLTVGVPLQDSDAFGESDWSVGARWAVGGASRWLGYHAGLGWTAQGGSAAGLGDAADTFHVWAGVSAGLGKGWSAEAVFRIDDAPFANVDAGKAGRTTGEFAVGLSMPLGSRIRWHLALGEDFPGMGMNPDFSIQSSLRFAGGSKKR